MVLVEGGADVDLEDYNGATPIINACRANQYVMVTFLLEHNADPNRQTKVRWSKIPVNQNSRKTAC